MKIVILGSRIKYSSIFRKFLDEISPMLLIYWRNFNLDPKHLLTIPMQKIYCCLQFYQRQPCFEMLLLLKQGYATRLFEGLENLLWQTIPEMPKGLPFVLRYALTEI